MAEDTPALLDGVIDSSHRSFLAVVQRVKLNVLRPRPPTEFIPVDPRWVPRLSEAGLLTIGRLAESGSVQLDRSLLMALVDRWRPETNTFHLPCGEMTPTLQDVAMLLGLPISGDAVGPRVVPPTWLDDLEERFANIDIAIDVEEHPKATGPAKAWILQFQPDNLAHDADDDSVTRSLEAHLLWLFGYIMFNNSHGAYVDRVLVPYAMEIAEAAVEEMPQYSWGAAVLVATYRGLCKASVQNKHNAILTGCPILLQLWSYERIAIGRPLVDHSPYELDMYGDTEDDRPTMGTLWYARQKRWAHVQSRRAYPEFVAEFDRLTPEDVVWEPYSELAINTRAPIGISSVCFQDQAFWMTTTTLVYDVYIEAHCPDRVKRQFGQRQLYPVPSALDRVERHDHSLSRTGQPFSNMWVTRV